MLFRKRILIKMRYDATTDTWVSNLTTVHNRKRVYVTPKHLKKKDDG